MAVDNLDPLITNQVRLLFYLGAVLHHFDYTIYDVSVYLQSFAFTPDLICVLV